MHSFEFGGLVYEWRVTQEDQVQLWGTWTEGIERHTACLLLLQVEELRLLLETGAKVLREIEEDR